MAESLPDRSEREAYEARDAKISYAGRRGMNSFADVEKALMDCAVAVGYPVESTAEDFDVVGVVADMVGSVVRERDRLQADATRLADGLRARGITPGRNPDGINDDAEKALTLYDDALAERDRLAGEVERLKRKVEVALGYIRDSAKERSERLNLTELALAYDENGETK